MRKIFLTFGDGAENFIQARERICREARATKQFDEILSFGWDDIKDKDVLASPLRDSPRGCGYWIWKPAIIHEVMAKMSEGDVLVYCDCGDVLSTSPRQWRKFFAHLDNVDIICKRISACCVHRCRKELLEKFAIKDRDRGCRLCFQYEMGATFIKKTSFTHELITDWLRFMVDNPMAIEDPNSEGELSCQLPTFIENRHDQSAFSILLYQRLADTELRRKIKTVWEYHEGWWLFGEPCISTERNRTGVAVVKPLRLRLLRVAQRIVWRIQLFFERRGLCLFWEKGGWYGA